MKPIRSSRQARERVRHLASHIDRFLCAPDKHHYDTMLATLFPKGEGWARNCTLCCGSMLTNKAWGAASIYLKYDCPLYSAYVYSGFCSLRRRDNHYSWPHSLREFSDFDVAGIAQLMQSLIMIRSHMHMWEAKHKYDEDWSYMYETGKI